MKNKHVLFVVENNSVPFDFRVWNEAQAAKRFGYDVSVICPSPHRWGERNATIENIRIHYHPGTPEGGGKLSLILEYMSAMFWETILAFGIYLRRPFHIIHGANPPDHFFLIALLFKVFGVKYVFDHHDLTPENYLAKYGRKDVLHRMLLIMERLTFMTADAVIATNESYRKVAILRGKKDPKAVFVVRNGPDLARISVPPPRPEIRGGFRYLVGYVGIIGQQDGIENLLDIARIIAFDKKRSDIKFIVVGSGPHLKKLMNRSRELGTDRIVQFTGFVPKQELYEILATADVCVNPEFGNEFTDKSTMIKILEYMAFGKPIVQFFTHEGHVSAGEAAVYIRNNDIANFADELISLLEDPARRIAMGALGQKRIVEELCWEKQEGQLQRTYQQILSR